ncbi:hypothetical protein ACSBR1_012490 [Camellia fascicularis]
MVRYSWFFDHFFDFQLVIPDEVTQYTRSFLIYLFDTTLFANRENTVGLYLLGALVHLPQVEEYDYGGADLATLYCYMIFVCRQKTDTLGGYWRVWKYTSYLLFVQLCILFNFAFAFSIHYCFAFLAARTTNIAAWHAFTMRILFEGAFGRAYYLGERFIYQTRGVVDPDIPHTPPPNMRVVDDLHDEP